MQIRSFVIAYSLVLAILLFADRRPGVDDQNHYSHVVDLSGAPDGSPGSKAAPRGTRIIAPGALIPGTWSAGQIPPERLVAPLVVIDLNSSSDQASQITLEEIAAWESHHQVIPQGAVVAIRRTGTSSAPAGTALPITVDAAQFLMDARYVLGFAVEHTTDLTEDRPLARQLALHGTYVVDGATRFSSLPATGSLVIVAPVKNKDAGAAPVRILAMVR